MPKRRFHLPSFLAGLAVGILSTLAVLGLACPGDGDPVPALKTQPDINEVAPAPAG